MISKEESAEALKESKNALDESVAPLKEAKDAYYAALNEWEKSKNLSSSSPEGLISESQAQYEKEIEAWKNSREVSLELIKLNNSHSNYSKCIYVNHILQEKVDNVGKIDSKIENSRGEGKKATRFPDAVVTRYQLTAQ